MHSCDIQHVLDMFYTQYIFIPSELYVGCHQPIVIDTSRDESCEPYGVLHDFQLVGHLVGIMKHRGRV